MTRSRLLVAILAFHFAGCGSETQQPSSPSTPIEPALVELLAYYDAHYDPDRGMLRLPFASPGYHSRVAMGTMVHPTRESLIYALALLQRGGEADASRAAEILRRLLPLQDTDGDSPTYGVWPWLAEEPIAAMAEPDLNWADFCGAPIAQMLIDHADQLPRESVAALRTSLRHAAAAIRARDVGPAYTNVAVLGGGVCAAAGEILDDATLLAYGRRRLEGIVEHTARHGGFNEYNSPPYTKVVIAECERTLHLVRDEATRAAAESLRRTAWQTVAESFHPATGQWAGPHSRTSRNRLRKETVDFLARRTGVEIAPHPTMADGEPRGYAVVHPLPCPDDLAVPLRPKRNGAADPREIRRVFIRGKTDADSTIGTTWRSGDACLGSVNRSTFWTQRKPVIGYLKTAEDPAVVFRLRFLHDGRDFASMGLRTLQRGPRLLAVLRPLPRQGDWHPRLDRPTDGVFQAGDLRARFELQGVGVRAAALSGGRVALIAGGHHVVIHTTTGRFAGNHVVWVLGSEEDRVYLDAVCHHGDARAFNFNQPLECTLAAGIELLRSDQPPIESPPVVTFHAPSRYEASWEIAHGTRITVAD